MTSVFKLHEGSSDSTSNELDIFQSPPTKTSVLEGEYVEVSSLIKPGTDSPLEFHIDGSTDHYLDFDNTFLHVKCKVTNKNGNNIPTEPKVMPTNLLLHALFQTLTIIINGKEIEHESNYNYRAYTETLLNMGKEAKETHLKSSFWIKDDGKVPDTAGISEGNMDIMKKRAKLVSGSRPVDLFGKLHSNFSHQDKYLIPNLNITLKLTRSPCAFVLQKLETNDDEYLVDITNATLLVRKVKVHPSISIAHEKILSSGKKALYPVDRVETQFFTISPNRQSETINILQNKQEAKRIIIGFLDHSAKNGSYLHNSFRFLHCDVSSINLVVNGHVIPNKPIKMDFESSQYTRAYFELMSVCGKALTNEGNNISLEDFADGFCFFAFDNTPDLCRNGMHLVRYSTTTLEVQFKKPLEHTISVFVYGEFDEIYEIDQARIVTRASLG